MSLRHFSLWAIVTAALPGHVFAASSALPFKQEDAAAAVPMLGELTILLFAVALILLGVYIVLKRMRGVSQPPKWLDWLATVQDSEVLNIVSSKRVTAGTSLHIVEWEGGKLLVAVNNHSTVRLAELPAVTASTNPGSGAIS